MEVFIPTNQINFVTDATLLTNIMKCGRFTDLKHNKNFTPIGGKSNSLEIGSIIHKFMEVYYRNQMHGIGRSQAFGFGISAAELYIQGCPDCSKFVATEEQPKPKCNHQIDEYPGIMNTPSESEGYQIGWKYALDTCDQYHKFYQSDFWVTLDVETVRSKVLYEDDEIRILFKSKLDWIVDTNTAIVPCDHKTMKQNRDAILLNNQFMGQCRQLDSRNIYLNKIGLQKTLKPEDKFKRVSLSYSADQLMEWQSYILPYWCKQLVAWANQGHFPPNFSNCETKFGKCEFYEVCSANPNMREDILRQAFEIGNEWNPTNIEE